MSAPAEGSRPAVAGGSPATVTVAVMPKSTRNPYFEDCRKGALEAARELGFALEWDGPAEPDAARQARIVEGWMREQRSVIAVSVESSSLLTPVLKRARAADLKVLTWDADAEPEARDFTVVNATPESIAHALSFEVGRILAGRGILAAITSTLSAPNQNAWIASFRSRLAKEYPEVELVEVRPCHDDQQNARQQVRELLAAHPKLGAVVAFCSPAVPGAAEAVKESGRGDVRVTGVSLPALCRRYIEDGSVASVVIWQTRRLGYLVAVSAHALATGELRAGATSLAAGRLGTVMVMGDRIRLGRCHIVTDGNLEEFL